MREEPKPVHTLCHGDFWSNNILFTYGEDPDNPSSLIIIDYQLIFVGSPCYGKLFFQNLLALYLKVKVVILYPWAMCQIIFFEEIQNLTAMESKKKNLNKGKQKGNTSSIE